MQKKRSEREADSFVHGRQDNDAHSIKTERRDNKYIQIV